MNWYVTILSMWPSDSNLGECCLLYPECVDSITAIGHHASGQSIGSGQCVEFAPQSAVIISSASVHLKYVFRPFNDTMSVV